MQHSDELSVPFVEREASVQRAQTLKRSGKYEARRRRVCELLAERNVQGMTWRELGAAMNLHHGQISGLLSSMHAAGDIFALRMMRDKCHPYVLSEFRVFYKDDDRIDEPATTRASRDRRIVETAREFAAEFATFARLADARHDSLPLDLLISYARLSAQLSEAHDG